MAKIGEFESMKLIEVYQLHDTAHLVDEDAFCEAFRGGDVVKAWKKDLYEHRGTLLAQDLEEAFEIGNMKHEQMAWRHKNCYSISVGNILHNVDDGVMYICRPIGWEKLTMPMTF